MSKENKRKEAPAEPHLTRRATLTLATTVAAFGASIGFAKAKELPKRKAGKRTTSVRQHKLEKRQDKYDLKDIIITSKHQH